MKKYQFLPAIALASLSYTAAQAEPYLAVKTGQKCIACHVNPTGGGKRTPYGVIYGQTNMVSPSASSAKPTISGKITDQLSIGGNLRANLSATSTPNQDDQISFEVENLLFYTELELIKNQLYFYFDEQLAPGAALNREAYGLFWNKDRSAYLKTGKMFLPFGLRLEDDSAFIRQITGINYDTPDNGIEAGIEQGPWSINLAITNGSAGGNETDQGKQYSFRNEYVRPKWRVGSSLNFNDGTGKQDRSMGNVFAGLRTGLISWLAEYDHIIDRSSAQSEEITQRIGFVEANTEVSKGHNVKFTYEHLDPNKDISEDERNRISAVWEHSPFGYQQFRVGIRANDGIPQNDRQNSTELFIQSHTYF